MPSFPITISSYIYKVFQKYGKFDKIPKMLRFPTII